jgi:hypothetical protein
MPTSSDLARANLEGVARELAQKRTVVSDDDDGAFERLQRSFEVLARLHVQVVQRLVELEQESFALV